MRMYRMMPRWVRGCGLLGEWRTPRQAGVECRGGVVSDWYLGLRGIYKKEPSVKKCDS